MSKKKKPIFIIEESFKLAGKAGTQYHYLAQDDDFAVNSISINADNVESFGKAPKWIGLLLVDMDNPPTDWFGEVHDLCEQLKNEGETRAVELIEKLFAKNRGE